MNAQEPMAIPVPAQTTPMQPAPIAAVPQPVPVMSQDPVAYTEKVHDGHNPMHPAGTVTHPAGAEWTQSFCGCLTPADLCCMTFCCPCITYGRNMERMKTPSAARIKPETFNTSCILYTALMCFGGFQFILGMLGRTQHREQMGIEGSAGVDCLSHFCCSCCALIQESKEIDHRYGQLEG